VRNHLEVASRKQPELARWLVAEVMKGNRRVDQSAAGFRPHASYN
jgi:hypothetical protein